MRLFYSNFRIHNFTYSTTLYLQRITSPPRRIAIFMSACIVLDLFMLDFKISRSVFNIFYTFNVINQVFTCVIYIGFWRPFYVLQFVHCILLLLLYYVILYNNNCIYADLRVQRFFLLLRNKNKLRFKIHFTTLFIAQRQSDFLQVFESCMFTFDLSTSPPPEAICWWWGSVYVVFIGKLIKYY